LGDARLEVSEVALGDEEGGVVGSRTAASFGVEEVAERPDG